ncbi:MAG: zinc ABC transporter substrate-binding protein [Clostridium sp.]|nr:zinc ABC transporter substrate-binding protein [Clostridium sp.]
MKKFLALFAVVVVTVGILAGCSSANSNNSTNTEHDPNKITIVATLFPQYDFARQIAGDKANIELILPPGVESHTFDPSPSDIITIHNADVFLYTGSNMETWADNIIESLPESVHVLNVSKDIPLLKSPSGGHNHAEDDHTHTSEELHADELNQYDPHIWTSPVNAKIMVQNILQILCEADPDNAEYYTKNANDYLSQLDQLDQEIRTVVANGSRKEVVFGSRFALFYFTHEYGLEYKSAFDSCSTEAEPSAKTVSELITEVKEKQIPVIYYEELTDPKISRSISEETGAEMLLFHSCHNLSKADFENGETYLSLMKQNVENLKKGLE